LKVEFIKDFEATTPSGKKTIPAGSALDLAEEKASLLIRAGVAKVAEEIDYNPAALPFIDDRGRLVVPFDCPPKYRYWADGQTIKETLQELFNERAAIMQHDGGLTRDQAEQESSKIMTRYVHGTCKGVKDP
jgi:hypothetical protein